MMYCNPDFVKSTGYFTTLFIINKVTEVMHPNPTCQRIIALWMETQ